MRRELLELLLSHDEVADLDPAARRLELRTALIEQEGVEDVAAALEELTRAIDGYGPLEELMGAPGVTDIMINGPSEVWVERDGALERSGVGFSSATELTDLVERLLSGAGARADPSSPIVDARLADGSRIHVVMPPLAPEGPLVSIRRFPAKSLSLDDLQALGMFGNTQSATLKRAVADRRSIVISGATGTGKTTLLSALLGMVGAHERVVTIEEIPEISSGAPHVVSLVARRANLEGAGEVGLAQLALAALRMRPDRIVIGEVRGPEALVALRAMGSGHRGSMLTVHSSSAEAALKRLFSLALSATPNLSEQGLCSELGGALDLVVHLGRVDGRRAVTQIIEVP